MLGLATAAVTMAAIWAVAGAGITDALSAFEAPDLTEPVVERAWLSQVVVRLPARGALDVHARLHVTDESGIAGDSGTPGDHTIQVEMVGERPAAARAAVTPVLWAGLESGTVRDGVWDAVIRVNRSLPPGTYSVSAWPMDAAENITVVEIGTFRVLAAATP